MAASPSITSGLGRRLLADGLLTPEQAEEAVAGAKRDHLSLPLFLAQNAIVEGAVIAAVAADEFGADEISILQTGTAKVGIVEVGTTEVSIG